MQSLATILAIESSCDDTSVAIISKGKILANEVYTQKVHQEFGGVVPELASRAHDKKITATVKAALHTAGLSLDEIDAIAVTQGPGLMGSLLVGLTFAKGLALAYNKPIIGVNHIDAHLYANFIDQTPSFPFLGLTVSGGHTQIVYVEAPFKHTIIGETRDDAAGEAFDKVGKILGLEYPAGPIIDKRSKNGDPKFYQFPRGLVHEGLDFSFSGLKTAVLYYLRDTKAEKGDVYIQEHLDDICASVSEAITSVLIKKVERALKQYKVKDLLVAGGVSANSMLREKMNYLGKRKGVNIFMPAMQYCTDNAAMIAVTALFKYEKGLFDTLEMQAFANLKQIHK